MVWEKDAPNAGFSTGKPWLPVKPPQAAKAVDQHGPDSILAFYKDVIAFRKESDALRHGKTQFQQLPDPILAFTRSTGTQNMTCVFNLSTDPQNITVPAGATMIGPNNATYDGSNLSLPGNGFAFLTHDGDLPLTISNT